MPPDETLRTLLREARRIAVVGLDARPDRPAYRVAEYLQRAGYEIVPVHPRAREVLGAPGYATLAEAAAAGPIDIVDLFRRSDTIPALVDEIVAARPRLAWMQLGIAHRGAAERLEAAGITVVMDHCLKIEHHRLGV